MSLLKWKELAKSKTKLGNKINYVHNLITQHKIGENTSQESFAKVFKPVTSKLDDVIDNNLNLRMPQRRKRPLKKGEVGIDYAPEVDPYEDMDVEGLIDYGDYVPPQQEKQIVPKPPTYEESLKDIMEGKKEIYVDPQYFPQKPDDLPPEYDDDEGVDYTIADEDLIKETLNDLDIPNYESVDMIINQPGITPQKTKSYLNKIIKKSIEMRLKINAHKADVTKKYNSGKLSEYDMQMQRIRLNNAGIILNEYIDYHRNKIKAIKGLGIKGRKRKRGGNVMFFNDVKQLLNKLELIIGEIIAGNTSIQMRNTGVNILDTLLRMSTINKPQYNKLYKKYFKV